MFREANAERQITTKKEGFGEFSLPGRCCLSENSIDAGVKTTHVSDSSKCSSISCLASLIDTPSAFVR